MDDNQFMIRDAIDVCSLSSDCFPNVMRTGISLSFYADLYEVLKALSCSFQFTCELTVSGYSPVRYISGYWKYVFYVVMNSKQIANVRLKV